MKINNLDLIATRRTMSVVQEFQRKGGGSEIGVGITNYFRYLHEKQKQKKYIYTVVLGGVSPCIKSEYSKCSLEFRGCG